MPSLYAAADFAELSFFVVTFDTKGIGIGARLMNRFKALLVEQASAALVARRGAQHETERRAFP